ncbi:MAG TPA: peptidoglycan DD-metalloendopeptidase family protein [Thermoanaerobaculia bacterium]|nr:peptidoglycan DD-metalloendopeptidase family protein [Thermoanaerobaculia bacterium]
MIEIQIHPRSLRGRVRHLVLGRRAVISAIAAATLLLAFLLASMAAAPTVIRRAYRTSHLKMLRQEKAVQAQRLREHTAQMAVLQKMIDDQRVHVEKLIAVYGLGKPEAGYGGLPDADDEGELASAQRRQELLASSLDRLNQQITLLSRFESENQETIRHTPALLPIPAEQFVLTHPFGWRISPFTRTSDFHAGLDLAAPVGTPIHATADGVVTFAGRPPMRGSVFWWRFGNVVAIRHADRFVTIYGHCDRVQVRAGQAVAQGELIATVGSSGWSTNSHLHYEIRTTLDSPGEYRPVDPQIYILNYQWNNGGSLSSRREEGEGPSFEPLPAAFTGARRRG